MVAIVELVLFMFGSIATFGTLVVCLATISIVLGGAKDSKKYDEPDGSVYVQKNGKPRLD